MNILPASYVLRHKPTQLYVQVWGSRMKLGAELSMAPMFTTENLRDEWHKAVHRAALSRWSGELEKVAITNLSRAAP